MTLLLDSAIRGSALLVISLAAMALLRTRSAAVRHGLLAAAVFSTAAMPLLSALLPAWSLGTDEMVEEVLSEPDESPQATGATPIVVTAARIAALQTAAVDPAVIAGIWTIGFLFSASILVVGLVRLHRISTRSRPLRDRKWVRAARNISRQYGLRRPVRLLSSPDSTDLMTWGAARPRIAVPAGAVEWDEARIRLVLGHELAHIRRRDWLVHMTAEMLRCVYWFNPLVWIVCRRLRSESERAADDAVLQTGVVGSVYAAHLVDLARILRSARRAETAALAMARESSFERRVVAMLNSRISHDPLSPAALGLTVVALLALTLPLAGLPRPGQVTSPPEPTAAPALVPAPARALQAARGETPPSAGPPAIAAAVRTESEGPAETAAQESTGVVAGTVVDATGARIPGVTLTLSDAEGDLESQTVSDTTGTFRFEAVPPDTYRLSATLPGFQRTTYTNITLAGGEERRFDISLQVAGPAIEVEVSRERRPPQDPTPDAPVRIGGNVERGRILSQVPPVYPEDLQDEGVWGVVILVATIGTDGIPFDLRSITAPHTRLVDAAIAAVRQWRWEPYRLNGQPTEVVTTITVDFSLRD